MATLWNSASLHNHNTIGGAELWIPPSFPKSDPGEQEHPEIGEHQSLERRLHLPEMARFEAGEIYSTTDLTGAVLIHLKDQIRT